MIKLYLAVILIKLRIDDYMVSNNGRPVAAVESTPAKMPEKGRVSLQFARLRLV